jgi:hypothetical protein
MWNTQKRFVKSNDYGFDIYEVKSSFVHFKCSSSALGFAVPVQGQPRTQALY